MGSLEYDNNTPGERLVVRQPLRLDCTPSIGDRDFNGMGLDDATLSGSFSGAGRAVVIATIASSATPDTMNWTLEDEDGVTLASGTGVAVATTTALGLGLHLAFGATTGHTVGGTWTWAVDSDALEVRTSNALDSGYALVVRGSTHQKSGAVTNHLMESSVADATSTGLLGFLRSRGTRRAKAIIQNGDDLGNIIFYAFDGTTYRAAARILADVNGAPGVGDTPGRLTLMTSPDGASLPIAALTLDQDQSAAFAGAVGVTGALTAASALVGGGYGDTGVTVSATGDVQANGDLTVDGTSNLKGAVTADGGLRANDGVEESGAVQEAQVVFTVQPNANDLLVIGANTYEFGGVGGNINVAIAGVAAGTLANLIAAINGSGTESILASGPGTSLIIQSATAPGGTIVAANVSMALSAAGMTAGHVFDIGNVDWNTLGTVAAAQLRVSKLQRTITAAMVTAGQAVFRFPFTVRWYEFSVRAAGVLVVRTDTSGASTTQVAFHLAGGAAPAIQANDVLTIVAGE